MCGIWAVFGSCRDVREECNSALKIAHRGPDVFRLESVYQFPSCLLAFHRLADMDSHCDMQPVRVSQYPHIWLLFNGRIYNQMNLQQAFDFHNSTYFDGESVIHMYAKGGIEFAAKHLDGVFSFCLFDTASRNVYLGRDTFGVKPLYRILTENGSLSVSSEVKGLIDIVGHDSQEKIQHVLPGHVEKYNLDTKCQASFESITQFREIGAIPSYTTTVFPSGNDIKAGIRSMLESAVKKRMTYKGRIGCLLSGGLDSSLMTAILVKLAKEQNMPFPIRTFSVGMETSPDVAAARKVAKYLGTEHHEILFTPEEAIAAVEKVVFQVESYDEVTIRGSIGTQLLCKYVKEKTDTTVILSGEGADEILQGYKYFHKAPSAVECDNQSRRLCKDLSMFDIQRLDRISAVFGFEIRLPYLDQSFSSYYLSLDPAMRAPQDGVEKHLMRSAFDDTDLIPREILWRQKQPFNDCLTFRAKSLSEIIEDFVREEKTDLELDQCVQQFPNNPPFSKESLYYRVIFERFFPGQNHLTPYLAAQLDIF